MLKSAYINREAIQTKWACCLATQKARLHFKYSVTQNRPQYKVEVPEDEWGSIHRVSYINKIGHLDTFLAAYMIADIERDTNIVTNISFTKFEYENDLYQDLCIVADFVIFLEELFFEYAMNKICVYIFRDNPHTSRKALESLGFRYVGYHENHIRLYDGSVHTIELFDLFPAEFMNSKLRRTLTEQITDDD